MLDFKPENTPGATLRRLLVLLLAALVMAFGIAARADSVRLYDQVGIESQTVTLQQVAELDGPAARAFADVVLMTLEDGRGEYTVTLDAVEKALDGAGANWGLLSLRGFNTCRVTRLAVPPVPVPAQGQAVTANIETPIGLGTPLTLRALVEQHLAERVGVGSDELRITFSERDAKRLDIPILGRSVEIEPTSRNTLGRIPVVIRLYEGRSVAESITVSARAQHTLLAVVTTGPVARGEVFTRTTLQVRECVLDDNNITPVTDPSIIIGQESATSLRAGEIVAVRSVRAPIMVKRGMLVDVRCFVGGLIIRTVGHATEDGSLDDRILVRSDSTGDTFFAVVTGRQEVVVTMNANTQPETSTAMADDRDQEVMN
jgi:flagellar basal body P-ring formation protein FlgA